jgi:hypothetical protein
VQQRRGGGGGEPEHDARVNAALAESGAPGRIPALVRAGAPAGQPQLSPLSDQLDRMSAMVGKSYIFDRLALLGPAFVPDPDTTAWLNTVLNTGGAFAAPIASATTSGSLTRL